MEAVSNKFHGMTRQQAIDRLEKHKEWGWNVRTNDAIDMAIDAIKKEQKKQNEIDNIEKIIEKILYKFICSGCSECCNCNETCNQFNCDYYVEHYEWLKSVIKTRV